MIKIWCDKCLKEALNESPCKCETTYHRERLNPKDHFVNVNNMVCDSPTTENK